MIQNGSQIEIEAGTTIFYEGDRGDCAYLIDRGAVEVWVRRKGIKVVLAQRNVGELFGEMAIIDDHPRSATVTALERCELIMVTREQIRNRINQTDPILRMCLSVVLERFRATLKGLASINQGELPDSVYGRIIDQSAEYAYEFAIREIRLEREINEALHRHEFHLHYQPIIRLADRSVAGFEALIRWPHSVRGYIPPCEFIPAAEASGLIVPISRWAVKRACEFLARLQASCPPHQTKDMFIAINVSGRDFNDPSFAAQVIHLVAESGVEPANVKLEITETILLSQPEIAAAVLNKLRLHGFSLAIDDFGTGYSSLSYLHQFPLDTLKIDGSFVRTMSSNPKKRQIVESIVTLARHLNLTIIAEGIETRQQEQDFIELECEFGQGFLYSKALPEDKAETLALVGYLGRS
jgi:EAL domain-containing protein (putative c-di-GMP-specific phosphodiesterase class I)